jgi:predicted MFS family arabinose efflux permease
MQDQEKFEVSNGYRNYVLFILMVVYAFNFIDRQILVILQEPIKAELGLSDTQLGLMTGLTFALFYVVVGLPIARWADQGNRRNIVAISLTIWSAMTAISGFAQNYWQLLLARIGVGIGEAGGSPPSHAMISDYFPPEKRATALSIYSTGIYIGIMIGFLAGGYIAETFGWRYAFFIVGLPGILLALIVRFTVKEPPRGLNDKEKSETVPIKIVITHFISRKSMVLVALGSASASFVGYGNGNFMPAFLSRVHGMSITEIGITLSMGIGLGGAIGTFSSGFLADWLGKNDARWYAWLPALSGAIALPLGIYVLVTDNLEILPYVYFISVIFHAMYLGPTIAICHSLSKPAMRALVSAILFFILNLIGLGLGPLFVGVLSDYFATQYASESVRYALLTNLAIMPVVTIALYYFAGKQLVIDMKK